MKTMRCAECNKDIEPIREGSNSGWTHTNNLTDVSHVIKPVDHLGRPIETLSEAESDDGFDYDL